MPLGTSPDFWGKDWGGGETRCQGGGKERQQHVCLLTDLFKRTPIATHFASSKHIVMLCQAIRQKVDALH